MAEQPMIRCQIPQSWQAELEAIAQQTGQSLEQVVYEAIAQYLGKGVPAQAIAALQNRLEVVEQRVEQVDEALLQSLSTRLTGLEQLVARSSLQEPPVPSSAPLAIEAMEPEDEPDEIMESFRESEGFQERVRRATAPSKARIHNAPMTYEEIEDEPDEILYDFIDP